MSIFAKIQDWQQGRIGVDDVTRYALAVAGDRARDLLAEGVAWWEKVGRARPLALGEHKPNPSWVGGGA